MMEQRVETRYLGLIHTASGYIPVDHAVYASDIDSAVIQYALEGITVSTAAVVVHEESPFNDDEF